MRLFIAIDFPGDVKKEIQKIQKKLPKFDGKITEPENLHLTLKFLGDVDEKVAEQVKKELKKIDFKKFEAEIDLLGYFNPAFVKIVWLHVSNCEEIQHEVEVKLESMFKPEARFMSHLTIARVKFADKRIFGGELKKVRFDKIKFPVSSVKLKSSELTPNGPIYRDLLEIKLK
jgi:2'-5' RNA ligase